MVSDGAKLLCHFRRLLAIVEWALPPLCCFPLPLDPCQSLLTASCVLPKWMSSKRLRQVHVIAKIKRRLGYTLR